MLANALRQHLKLRCIFRPPVVYQSHLKSSSITTQALNEPFRILFMGRDEFSCIVLQELYRAEDVWKEIIIVTQPDIYTGRRRSVLSVSPLKLLANTLELPVHPIPEQRKEFRRWPLPPPFSNPESLPNSGHVLVTASFGRILSGKMLDAFHPTRRLNVHPSLLPKYRGPAPIQHTILNGEKQTGVCVIEMLKKSEGIDAGSLWGVDKMTVPSNADFSSLRDGLATKGGRLLASTLRDMLNGKALARPQPLEHVTSAPMITSEHAEIDFSRLTAQDIHRTWRAISHQKPITTFGPDGQRLQLLEIDSASPDHLSLEPGAFAFDKSKNCLLVGCRDITVLTITKLKTAGKADRDAQQFWNGLQSLLKKGQPMFLGLGKQEPP